jgi:hypothetical protein
MATYSPLRYNALKMRPARQSNLILTVFILIIFCSFIWYKRRILCGHTTYPATRAHENIAVASDILHYDVYLPLVWTLQRVMKGHGNVQVYARLPFLHNFKKISEELGLYHGSVKKPGDLIKDVESTAIDMVVIGTCELEWVHLL